MNITPLFNIYSVNTPKKYTSTPNFARLKPLEYDTVSFLGDKPKTTIQRLNEAPKDCFPSEGLKKYLMDEARKPENQGKTVFDLHKEYYSSLLTCKTLDEAKAMYSEFKDVVDVSTLDLSTLGHRSILRFIRNGKNKDLTLEDTSLSMLKKFYGEGIPPCRRAKSKYFNISDKALGEIFKHANISMDKRYKELLSAGARSEILKESWQNDDFRRKITNSISKAVNTPEYRKKRSEISKEIVTRDYIRERMKIVYEARTEAHKRHPEFDAVYKQANTEFIGMSNIRKKEANGIPLTAAEKKYKKSYHSRCNELSPNMMKIIGATQKEILAEWGFYDKD